MSKFDCHLYGPFYSASGVGESTRAYWRTISATGLKVGIIPQSNPYSQEEREIAKTYKNYLVEVLHPKLNFFRINAEEIQSCKFAENLSLESRETNVLIPMWETPEVPIIWKNMVNKFDHILAPTTFIANSFKTLNLNASISIAPHEVHIDEEVRYSVRALGLPDDRRIHLYSFSYASFQSRKNPNAFLKLKEIFKAKYEYGTDLFLLVASDLPRNATDVLVHEKLLAGQDSNFYYWPGGRRRSVHTSLIGNSNTFISLHRSEGIGLQLVEAALLRTPIVTHNFSGPSDFILDDDPGIYPWRNKMIFDHEYPHSAGQIWADFQISNVFDEFEKLHTTHNAQAQMQTRIERHFSLEETSRIFAAALKTF